MPTNNRARDGGEGQEMENKPKKDRKKTGRRQWNLESKNLKDR
jgi:hypothetical protein